MTAATPEWAGSGYPAAPAAAAPGRAAPEVRTCYCGTTAAVVPGVFPHRDCDGSAGGPATATPGQADGIEVTHDPELPVHLVQLRLCDPCIDGTGEQCHTPGCSLWLNRPPDIGLRDNPSVTIAARQPPATGVTPGQAAYEVGDRVCVTGVVVATNRHADWVTVRSGCSLFAVDEASANPELTHAEGAIAAQQPQPALVADLEAQVRLWRQQAQLDAFDDGDDDGATANAIGQCALELAQIIAKHAAVTKPAPRLDLAGNEMRPGELDEVLASVPPCDEVSPWGMRCRVVRAHQVHRDRDGNMWPPAAGPGTWTVSECLERIGVLAGALHEIKGAYTSGTMAHDTAHAALDQSAALEAKPKPAPDLAAAIQDIIDRYPEQEPAPEVAESVECEACGLHRPPTSAEQPVSTAWRLLDEARAENGRMRGLISQLLDSTGLDGAERARWLEMAELPPESDDDEDAQ